MIQPQPTGLERDGIRLEPLSVDHAAGIAAAVVDGELWNLWFTSVPEPAKASGYVDDALKGQQEGHMLPWAVRDLHTGKSSAARAITTSCRRSIASRLATPGTRRAASAAGITVKESAAYSAVERLTGTLHGKKGSFALQHTGIMDKGKPSLTITVVPDSGTAELTDLTGKLDIIIEGKEHKYVFEYSMTKE